MKRLISALLSLILCLGATGCASQTNEAVPPSSTTQQEAETDPQESRPPQSENIEDIFSADTAILDVINDPAFTGYGRFLFPTERRMPDDDMKIRDMASLFPFHNHINIDTAVSTLNTMREMAQNGGMTFHNVYTEEDIAADPSKENTGLFFFRGEADAPFAVINAGGGFSYVGSLHAAFPLALDLNGRGYNAFVLQYRTGGLETAAGDLAAAISYIFENAEELQVSTENYSLWGGSAGARMAARVSSYGTAALGGDDLPAAAAVIMQYTAYQDYTGNEPPTFACVGENDHLVDPVSMQQRINNLSSAGVDTEFHIYPGMEHGWGYGKGTAAEVWMDEAVAFWEGHMSK